MQYLSRLDLVIISLYFTTMIIIGLVLRRRASRSIEHYFIGGRKLPWWALGITGMASNLDISGTMLIVSFVYLLGPKGLFIEFRGGAVLTIIVMMLWTGKWHRRSGVMTGSDWLIFRFGDNWGGRFAELARVTAAVVGTIGTLSYLIIGVGLFFSMFLPLTPFECALLMIGITTFYTMISGFYGVVVSDIVQAMIIWIGVIAISVLAYQSIDTTASLASLAMDVTGNKDWTSSMPSLNTHMPQGYEAFQHLTLFMVFYLMRNLLGGMGMGDDPKFFGARNERECGKLSFLWTVTLMFRWPMVMGFAVLGLFMVHDLFPDQTVLMHAADIVKMHYPEVTKTQWVPLISDVVKNIDMYPPDMIAALQEIFGTDDWIEKLQLVGFEGTVNPERILPAVMMYSVNSGLRGLLIVAMIAAGMSTFNTKINEAGGFLVRNLYQRYIRPKAKNREIIFASYTATLIITVLSFLFAFTIQSINDIWGWIAMGLGGGLLVPIILRLYWWRFNGQGFAIGTIVGLIAAIIQRFAFPELNDIAKFLWIILFGLSGTIIGTLLTKPTHIDVLNNFYRITRPFGFWKPLRSIMSKEELSQMDKEHRNDIMALPFATIFHITLFLLPMQFIIRAHNSFIFTLIAFLIGAGGLYHYWYKNLPKN